MKVHCYWLTSESKVHSSEISVYLKLPYPIQMPSLIHPAMIGAIVEKRKVRRKQNKSLWNYLYNNYIFQFVLSLCVWERVSAVNAIRILRQTININRVATQCCNHGDFRLLWHCTLPLSVRWHKRVPRITEPPQTCQLSAPRTGKIRKWRSLFVGCIHTYIYIYTPFASSAF